MECSLTILIEYFATKREQTKVADFLIAHLLAKTHMDLLGADVYFWNITKEVVPQSQLHILTDMMGLDKHALTLVLPAITTKKVISTLRKVEDVAWSVR